MAESLILVFLLYRINARKGARKKKRNWQRDKITKRFIKAKHYGQWMAHWLKNVCGEWPKQINEMMRKVSDSLFPWNLQWWTKKENFYNETGLISSGFIQLHFCRCFYLQLSCEFSFYYETLLHRNNCFKFLQLKWFFFIIIIQFYCIATYHHFMMVNVGLW